MDKFGIIFTAFIGFCVIGVIVFMFFYFDRVEKFKVRCYAAHGDYVEVSRGGVSCWDTTAGKRIFPDKEKPQP